MHSSVTGFPLRFCQLHEYLFVSFLAKFLGVQDFSHAFSVASVVIIINEGGCGVCCVCGCRCVRVRRSREGTAAFSRNETIFVFKFETSAPALCGGCACSCGVYTLLTKANREPNTAIAALCS
jgi:hypothetical protein